MALGLIMQVWASSARGATARARPLVAGPRMPTAPSFLISRLAALAASTLSLLLSASTSLTGRPNTVGRIWWASSMPFQAIWP